MAVPLTQDPTATSDASIEVRIRDVRQLFNSLDATPFPETDLDAEAEEFILSWAMEFRSDAVLRIRIHLEQPPVDDEIRQQVQTAIRSYFAYRAGVLQRRFRHLMARGRLSLVIGLSCLAISVAAANVVARLEGDTLVAICRESLIIGGWVAMWRPLEILLYDWWPLQQERRVCDRLSAAEVEIVADVPSHNL